jgi:hypothetical protein
MPGCIFSPAPVCGQERIYNVNTGHGEYDSKRGTGSKDGIADTITITSFDNSGEELPNRYFFINAWLQNVEEVSIDYSQSEAVRYQATFQYDFYTYGKTSLEFGANATSTVEQEDAGEPKAEASDN